MNQIKRCMRLCVLVFILTIFVQAASTAHAASVTCGAWSIVKSPSPGSSIDKLYAVAKISASNVWAVGTADNTGIGGLYQTLTEHWNGSGWSYVKSPNVGTGSNLLKGVAAISSTNVWAVGYYYPSSGVTDTLIEQWNGTSWKVVTSPNVGTNSNILLGVAAISANNVWAVGEYSNTGSSYQTLIENWNGTKWSVVASPNNGTNWINQLNGIAVVSASDIWAVGYYYNPSIQQTLTEHWNGTSWSIVASPSPATNAPNTLNAVSAVSSSDVWAVGYYQNKGTFVTLIEQWNGGSWSIVPSPSPVTFPNGSYLNGVVAVSASDVWAVGDYGNLSNVTTIKTLIEQWNGTSWSIVTSPNGGSASDYLNGATAVDANHVWAVGSYYNVNTPKTLTEFYC